MRPALRLFGTFVAGAVLPGCDYLSVKPTFDVSLVLPAEVVATEAFPLGVDVKNPHGSAITLDSVDIDDALLKGLQVISVDPKPKDTMHVPVLNQRSWTFGLSVPAGSVQRVTFNVRPLNVGRFSGNVGACNPGQDCASTFADLVVKARRP